MPPAAGKYINHGRWPLTLHEVPRVVAALDDAFNIDSTACTTCTRGCQRAAADTNARTPDNQTTRRTHSTRLTKPRRKGGGAPVRCCGREFYRSAFERWCLPCGCASFPSVACCFSRVPLCDGLPSPVVWWRRRSLASPPSLAHRARAAMFVQIWLRDGVQSSGA
jgi:hypothetical protein